MNDVEKKFDAWYEKVGNDIYIMSIDELLHNAFYAGHEAAQQSTEAALWCPKCGDFLGDGGWCPQHGLPASPRKQAQVKK